MKPRLWTPAILICSWGITVFASTQNPAADNAQTMTPSSLSIYLDPGHGGSEAGAVANGVIESHLMLQFSQELQTAFEKKTPFRILTSRQQDQAKPLAERVAQAHAERADLFISLHANSATTAKAKGIEIFFQSSLKDSNSSDPLNQMIAELQQFGRQQTSFRLSQNLKANLAKNQNDLKATPIRIKQAPFYVLMKTQIPSLLIEIGFLTHPREHQKLKQKNYREQIAEEIVMAVKNFVDTRQLQKDFSDKPSGRILN